VWYSPAVSSNPSSVPNQILTALGLTALFNALFPWLLSFQGLVHGWDVSIRTVGKGWAIILFMLAIAILTVPSVVDHLCRIAADLDALRPPESTRFIIICTAYYALGIASHKLRAQYTLGTHAFDLGFFSNICWNTLHGNWFYSSILERNFMAIHVNWILWPLSALYTLRLGASILLVAQAAFVSAAIPFLWLTVKDITGSFSAGGLASLLFVCSPVVGQHIANDFHPDSWQLPCLMSALWFWRHGRGQAMLAACALALLAKEDVSFVLSGFAVFLILRRENGTLGWELLLISVGVFLFHTQVFIPKFLNTNAKSVLFFRYRFLGNSYGEMLTNLVRNPSVYAKAFAYQPVKYWRFLKYTLPALGLVFLDPLFLVPPVISVLPHLLSQAQTQLNLADIYAIPSLPFIFVGSAFGFSRLWGSGRWRGHEPKFAAICLMVAAIGIMNSPRFFEGESTDRLKAFYEIKKLVPPDVSMAAQQNLLPHFDDRRTIQIFPIGISMPALQTRFLTNPEYVVCDRVGNALPYNRKDLMKGITDLEANPSYQKAFEKVNFILFKRRPEPERWIESQ